MRSAFNECRLSSTNHSHENPLKHPRHGTLENDRENSSGGWGISYPSLRVLPPLCCPCITVSKRFCQVGGEVSAGYGMKRVCIGIRSINIRFAVLGMISDCRFCGASCRVPHRRSWSRRAGLLLNVVTYRSHEFHLVAGAKRLDIALSFCWFDGLIGQGENLVYDSAGWRLRLFTWSSSNSQLTSTAVMDEFARRSWLGDLLYSLFVPDAVEEVMTIRSQKPSPSPDFVTAKRTAGRRGLQPQTPTVSPRLAKSRSSAR